MEYEGGCGNWLDWNGPQMLRMGLEESEIRRKIENIQTTALGSAIQKWTSS